MSVNSSLRDWICLSMLPGLGPVGAVKFLQRFGNATQLLKASLKEIATVPGIRAQQLAGFNDIQQYQVLACQQLEKVKSLGGAVLPYNCQEYPELLRQIPDPPIVLYTLGDVTLLNSHCVALVGSRAATSYGRRVASSFAETLAAHSLTVVSGMALGVDSEAHHGALKAHGKTIGVLGCGLDVVYPPQNYELYQRIRDRGLLVSEYPPGTKPDGFRFPARNRIIAGISQGVVVVEAARKSGSLITAQMALDFGREIFAVPGQVDSFKSEGTHWLLRQGAQLVASGLDIVEELRHVTGIVDNIPCGKVGNAALSGLDPDASDLLQYIEAYPLSRDEVSEKSGLSAARLSELFLFLELEGHIEMQSGDMVCRVTP